MSRADLVGARAVLSGRIGLVPTMGALHAGHARLLDTARAQCDAVITTNFVNPLQFGPAEDLARYPRTLDADLALCEQVGVDLVWAPAVADVYPYGTSRVHVSPGPLGEILEGAVRPGHFAGVLTVVAKFLNTVRPDCSYYGEKDYQQLTLIRQMCTDLDLGVEIIGVPTVRESDGLALSSRNRYLSPSERKQALALSRALFAGAEAADAAPRVDRGGAADAALTMATGVLAAQPGVAVDYLELRGPDLGHRPEHGAARLLVAARVGTTRLIDNVAVQL